MSRAIEGYDAQGNPVVRTSTDAEDANLVALIAKARTALTSNASFLAIQSPTAAQNTAQAKALTRQVNAIIRVLLSELSDVSDT